MEMYGSRSTTNSRWVVRYVGKALSHPTMTLSNDTKAFERGGDKQRPRAMVSNKCSTMDHGRSTSE